MSKPIYKLLLFLKRRPGLSVQEFRDYYENTHRVLCEKYAIGAARYVRRYVDPVGGVGIDDLPFDVITEVWIEDRAMFEKVAELTARNEPPPDILADEEHLFDRSKSRVAAVIEYDSVLPS